LKFSLPPKARYLIAVLAGLCWAASFPKFNIAGLAWVAPGLMLLAASGQAGRRAFRLGYVAGLAHYLTSLYWLLFIPFPAGAVVGWLALSAYLALYPATWVWLCWRFFPVAAVYDRRTAGTETNFAYSAPPPLEALLAANGWQRAGWALLCAALWVALEMIVSRLLTGFPWNLLGVSQFRVLPLIQIASVTGVYGISFLIVWFSVSLAIAVSRLAADPKKRWGVWVELRLALIGLFMVGMFGINKVLSRPTSGHEITLALVQPSIAQELIWDRREDSNRFNKMMHLSETALTAKPDALVWPEAALPDFTEDNFRAITNLVASHKVWMIFGAEDAERTMDAKSSKDYDFFNAAFLCDPKGNLAATYHKQQLVMFGEYVPLAGWLPFVRRLIPVPSDFTPGRRPVPFELNGPRARISVLICFEDVFPHVARHYVEEDTDFLLNLTNDGWFGESAAQWQQAANAVFRAVENGLPLVRCTNNGLTCWIDSRGQIREIYSAPGGDVYGAGFMTVRVPLLADGQKRELTFYRLYGDWFGWSCVAIGVIALAGKGWSGRKRALTQASTVLASG
jgi:apolipoprotein N-acyltransferase